MKSNQFGSFVVFLVVQQKSNLTYVGDLNWQLHREAVNVVKWGGICINIKETIFYCMPYNFLDSLTSDSKLSEFPLAHKPVPGTEKFFLEAGYFWVALVTLQSKRQYNVMKIFQNWKHWDPYLRIIIYVLLPKSMIIFASIRSQIITSM